MPDKPIILFNPVVRWAISPAEQGSIRYIEGIAGAENEIPHEGDIIARPFLVDPETRQPIPVRVIELRYIRHDPLQTVVAIAITRAHRTH